MGINTICTHAGNITDEQFQGAVSPMYLSSSYAYTEVDVKRYPRYFNTPNQEALNIKLAALEGTEDALVFGSGMAAVSTLFLAFLKPGDHIIMQEAIYGGTANFAAQEFTKLGIAYTMIKTVEDASLSAALTPATKMVYVETPSNPKLEVVDLELVSAFAKANKLISVVDNTFASPINQNPAVQGMDLVFHSATKYMGGHSDLAAGAVCGSKEHIAILWDSAKNYGGSLSDMTVWMLERSIKTMGLRVKQQSKNALKLAKKLIKHNAIAAVYYPGLKSHPGHEIAQRQMSGYGGMMSFELVKDLDARKFLNSLNLIKDSMSLAGVESTMLSPAQTSHSLLTQAQRDEQGITDGLIRFSVGIEEWKDLLADIEQAIAKA